MKKIEKKQIYLISLVLQMCLTRRLNCYLMLT